jgi:SWI/SNF-related matrix-associated actin-dependent regulator 1 of chromatin subfamily A
MTEQAKERAIIYLQDGFIRIKMPFDRSAFKILTYDLMFSWNKDLKVREIKRDLLNARSAKAIKDLCQLPYQWVVDDQCEYSINSYVASGITEYNLSPADIKPAPKMCKPDGIDYQKFLKLELADYQQIGLNFFIQTGGRAILGDDMGLGKTAQTIAYCALKNFKTLVVCPVSLKLNWVSEVTKFSYQTAGLFEDMVSVSGRPSFDYTIINYERLIKNESLIKGTKFDCVVLDESHYIKNTAAKRTKIAMKLFGKYKHVILLSGTAIKNRPIDFFPQLKLLSPSVFSNKQEYGIRYCAGVSNRYGFDFSGSSREGELSELIKSFYLRREKSQVLKELPPKVISDIVLEMSKDERSTYLGALKGAKSEYSGQLSQGNDNNKSAVGLGKLTTLNRVCAEMKVAHTIDFVENVLEEDSSRKVLVFSNFIETRKMLMSGFGSKAVGLSGEDKEVDRAIAIKKFQEEPNIKVFVVSTLAGGVGNNFTASDCVVFVDQMWSPADMAQAADRAHRRGQTKTVFVYNLLFKDSIDLEIKNSAGDKSKVIRSILGD